LRFLPRSVRPCWECTAAGGVALSTAGVFGFVPGKIEILCAKSCNIVHFWPEKGFKYAVYNSRTAINRVRVLKHFNNGIGDLTRHRRTQNFTIEKVHVVGSQATGSGRRKSLSGIQGQIPQMLKQNAKLVTCTIFNIFLC